MIKIAIVLAFVVLDFVSGMIKAFKKQEFDSSIMRDGLINKIGELITLILAELAEKSLPYFDVSIGKPIFNGICTYIILMEIGSVIENVGNINKKIVPAKLRKFFKKIGD